MSKELDPRAPSTVNSEVSSEIMVEFNYVPLKQKLQEVLQAQEATQA